MSQKTKIRFLIAGVLVLIAGVTLIYVFNSPRADISDAKTDYCVTAAELIAEFETSETEATAKYTDKIIEVSGMITTITQNELGATCYLSDADAMGGVMCEFEPGSIKMLLSKKVGDEVVMKGKFSGYLLDVVLNTCTVMK